MVRIQVLLAFIVLGLSFSAQANFFNNSNTSNSSCMSPVGQQVMERMDRIITSLENTIKVGNDTTHVVNKRTPELVNAINGVRDELKAYRPTFEAFQQQTSIGYVVGTATAVVAASLVLGGIFVGVRYGSNQYFDCVRVRNAQDNSDLVKALAKLLASQLPTAQQAAAVSMGDD
ncbi:MAG: hypothetical protein JKY15_08830 [Deltaproteobacteria bacterium]|nr:hypothetical protein [Deltaproteobacteria bacterium]